MRLVKMRSSVILFDGIFFSFSPPAKTGRWKLNCPEKRRFLTKLAGSYSQFFVLLAFEQTS
jgi:hypothetical protein